MAPHDEGGTAVQEVGDTAQDDFIEQDPEDRAFLNIEPGDIFTNNLEPPERLGRLTIVCIICNRMIGTGIFTGTSKIVNYTESVGVTLLFWLGGAIATMAGIIVYMEFGLTTPRYHFAMHGKLSVPRNGAELHYLKDIFRWPKYLSTCVFGVAYVLLGNTATNSLSFGIRVLEASGNGRSFDESGRPTTDFTTRQNWTVRAIAMALVSIVCLFHSTWRKGGIWLNNIFGLVKITMLLVIFLTGLVSYAGAFDHEPPAARNFNIHGAFKDVGKEPTGFAESFLAIIFAYGGFQQANYVLSEIDDPKRKYKWWAPSAVALVCVLYILVNVAYFIVVPKEELLEGEDVGRKFFLYTFGQISSDGPRIAPQVLDAFAAVSSLGNIIVMTYVAARVKQEIAKEGILPLRKFLSNATRIPLPSFLTCCFKPTRNETPIGALLLHWSVSILLILATGAQKSPLASYQLLVSLYSYTIDAIFGLCLGLGLLFLRIFSSTGWTQKSRKGSKIPPLVSIVAATLYTIANAFPVIASFIKPAPGFVATTGNKVPWYTTPTVSWCVIGLGVVYWLVFSFVVPHVGKRQGHELKVKRKLYFHEEHGYPVQWHEKLNFKWVTGGDGFAEEEIETRTRREVN